jgi:hypothetical protein
LLPSQFCALPFLFQFSFGKLGFGINHQGNRLAYLLVEVAVGVAIIFLLLQKTFYSGHGDKLSYKFASEHSVCSDSY